MTKTTELALALFLLGVAVLVATATTEDPALPRLAWARIAGAGGAALLLASGLVLPLSGFALGAATLALLWSVLAIWRAQRDRAALRAWRDGFERPFAEYVASRTHAQER